MDAVSDPGVKSVVCITSAQVGKTESILNCIGFHIAQDPAPILVVQPTLSMAQSFSKDRLAPMLRDTPALKGKVQDPRSRDSGNTTLHKVFPGGHITVAGANSAAGLASRPVRIVLCDEVDRYPPSAGTEGDPVKLAAKRAQTFWNSKLVMLSTPTIKGVSRIEAAFEESDKRRFFVPCPDCDEHQALRWKQVRWEEDRPETAVYVCEHCGSVWDDNQRLRAIRCGEWRAEGAFRGSAGFHLSELYSSWSTLGDIAENFLEAKKLPETLKTFVNTSLGESWEDAGEGIDDVDIWSRREGYTATAMPLGVLVLTAGVDVQDDRIEIEVTGWGLDEESWSVDHIVLTGDPSTSMLWNDLDNALSRRYRREDGREHRIAASCVDTGGHYTQAAYDFCRPRYGQRVYAIKGMAGMGRPVWPKRPSKNNSGRLPLFLVGVDAAKDVVFGRLKVNQPGPGFCHFPAHYDDEYFHQLAAERVITRYRKGIPFREYIRVRKRNEALDLRVYSYAAFVSLNADLHRIAERDQAVLVGDVGNDVATPRSASPQRRPKQQNWVNGWR